MFPAENYNDIYIFALLAITLLTGILYARGAAGQLQSEAYNAAMAPAICIAAALFLGTRPISGVFIDMTTYDTAYRMSSVTGTSNFTDWAFSSMLLFFSSNFESSTFFLVCALIYLLPLLWLKRIHDNWAFAVILAHIGAFSFFSYGVNVIRHGMAASLLIAAVCNRDKKWLMVILATLSAGMHKAVLAPIAAFLAALLFNSAISMWACWACWFGALIISWLSGGVISDRLMNFALLNSDDKLLQYLGGVGNDKGGFRWDFILYSIVPLIITFALAGQSVRKDRVYRMLMMTYLLTNSFWLLVIYAAYSDRFAYLSWFLLPWLITYPFVPKSADPYGKASGPSQINELRLGMLAAALVAHFAFTFFMMQLYYKGRF
jgi:hypothetical protein